MRKLSTVTADRIIAPHNATGIGPQCTLDHAWLKLWVLGDDISADANSSLSVNSVSRLPESTTR